MFTSQKHAYYNDNTTDVPHPPPPCDFHYNNDIMFKCQPINALLKRANSSSLQLPILLAKFEVSFANFLGPDGCYTPNSRRSSQPITYEGKTWYRINLNKDPGKNLNSSLCSISILGTRDL